MRMDGTRSVSLGSPTCPVIRKVAYRDATNKNGVSEHAVFAIPSPIAVPGQVTSLNGGSLARRSLYRNVSSSSGRITSLAVAK